MSVDKIPFPSSEQLAKLPHEERAAVCLELIAHNLDRIESHLKRIAKAAEGGDIPSPKAATGPEIVGAGFRRS